MIPLEMYDCVSYPKNNGFGLYTEDGGCIALTEMLCRYGVCKFYKNKEMLYEQREKCQARIMNLISNGTKVPTYVRVSASSNSEKE